MDNHVDYEGSESRDVYEAAKDADLVRLAVNHDELEGIWTLSRIKSVM